MRIATFIMCHNEEKLLPYTLRHYLQFSEVYFSYPREKVLQEYMEGISKAEVVI